MRKENSTNFENEKALQEYCSAFKIISLISGRWKLHILFALHKKEMSYTNIKNLLPKISDRILIKQLNELIEHDLIIRNKTKTASIYSLSNYGRNFSGILNSLKEASELTI